MNAPSRSGKSSSRRDFLRQSSGCLAGTALAGAIAARSYAGEQNTIQVALIGCGGRGTGAAAQALSTKGPTRLCAMADVFPDRLKGSLGRLSKQFPKQVDVPRIGSSWAWTAYKKAIDAIAPGGVVLLATPPGFRPIHVEYAVAKGCHVFMEKSFAVDAPGIRRVLKAGEEATKKNLISRRWTDEPPLQAAGRGGSKIHDGAIGKVITAWASREHGPVGFSRKAPGQNDLAHQIRNYSCFTWLNGSFLLDWLIHNLDVCCWVKDAWPVSAQGQGGRQARTEPDQLFDHYAVEYSFADGTRLLAQGRHQANTWGFFGDVIHGAKGSAVLGEGITHPKLYNGHQQTAGNQIWQYQGPPCNHYQVEHDLLFAAIREDKPYNETQRCAYAAMTGILGRMAAESGQMITWEQAMQSNLELAPGLDKYTMESEPPIKPDAQGRYPVAIPGLTKVL